MSALTLAYHDSAAAEADQLARVARGRGAAVQTLSCGSGADARRFAERLLDVAGPCLLLVNDGLLQARDCQLGLLDAYRQLRERADFEVALASLEREGPGGSRARVLTSLARVSDVIRYMNFWQHAYLLARRDTPAGSGGEAELAEVRLVSQEIGETLRLIREQQPRSVYDYLAKHGQPLADRFGLGPWRGESEDAVGDPDAATKLDADSAADAKADAGVPEQPEAVSVSAGEPTEQTTAIATDDGGASSGEDVASHEQESRPESAVELQPAPPVAAATGGSGLVAAAGQAVAHAEAPRSTGAGEREAKRDSAASPDESPQARQLSRSDQTSSSDESRSTDETSPADSSSRTDRPASIHASRTDTDAPPVAAAAVAGSEERASDTTDDTSVIREDEGAADSGRAYEKQHSDAPPESDLEPSAEEAAALLARARAKARRANRKRVRKLLRRDRPQEAIAFAQRALHEDPDDDALRFAYALALLESGDKRQRREAGYELERLADGDLAAAAALVQGQLAAARRDYGSARRYYRQAYRLDASVSPDLAYRLGALLQDQFPERERAAQRYLREATRRDGEHVADAWYRLGLLERGRGRWRRAARALKTAYSLDRRHAFAAYELATLYLDRDRHTRASKYFRAAIKHNPELDTEQNRAAFAPALHEVESEGFERYVTRRDGEADRQAENYDEPSVSLQELAADAGSAAGAEPQEKDGRRASRALSTNDVADRRERALTVLISGATSGIGAATARVFAEAGHRLILTGRRVERLREVRNELREAYGTEVRLLAFDVRDYAAAEGMIASLTEDWSSVDILVNNAGKAKGLDYIHEGDLAHWEEMIDTNVKGLLYLTRLVTPGMVERGGGHVVNVCSTAGHEVYPRGAVYCATKHAVDALTKGMRLDLHAHGIRVSQVSPAHVEETEFARVRFDGDAERAAAVYEGWQPLRARDVGQAIYDIVAKPAHVNVQDVLMLATQQANSTTIARD